MTHKISLNDFMGFYVRTVIASSLQDKKKLEIVVSKSNNFVPCFELMTTKGVTKHPDLNAAISAYNDGIG